jgi:glycosyltransferase involved in cell wall biosynthesis
MKFLLTTHQFFPEFHSGTEVLTLSVAKELRERGHDVTIFTGYPTEEPLRDEARLDEYTYQDLRVVRFHHSYVSMGGQTSKIEVGYNNALGAAYFRALLASFRPDVVHFFHLNRLGSGLIPVAVDAGVPAYFTPTDFWTICATGQMITADGMPCMGPNERAGNCIVHFASMRFKGPMRNVVARIPVMLGDGLSRVSRSSLLPSYPFAEEVAAMSNRLAVNIARLNQLQGIVVPNVTMERLMVRYGVEPARICRRAYGIDLGGGPIARPRSASPRLRLGFIGTLASYKGCHVLLDAVRRLPRGSVSVKIHGRESDFPKYVAQLRDLAAQTDGVRFGGVFPISDIGKVMSEIDVLVVPSLWNENTPLVIYAGQNAGCVVVGSNVPGIAEAVRDGVDGLLFSPGDAAALAAALRQLVDFPSRVALLRENCRAPKSIAQYVDELMSIWFRGQPSEGDRTAKPLAATVGTVRPETTGKALF